MNVAVDFLPAEYRARLVRARVRRERILLAIPVAAGLVVTDLILRMRVDLAQQIATNAVARADQGEQRAVQIRQLAQRLATNQADLEAALVPFTAPRAIQMLDAVVADQPPGVTLHEVVCRHEPWARSPQPNVRIHASCSTTAEFEVFLAALRQQPALPPLQCVRTFRAGNGVGFHLETPVEPASPR
jgi:hypothetical protein